MDVYEALWGPLKHLPNNADEEARIEYCHELVETEHILLASVGIAYDMEMIEDEEDYSGGAYRMEGLLDQWVAIEVCKVCAIVDFSYREGDSRL